MIDLDHRSGLAQGLILGDLLHRQDRTNRNVDRIADFHDLELALGHGPLLDAVEDGPELRQARHRRRVFRIGLPGRLADYIADRAPHRSLGDEVDVGVGIALPPLALDDPAGLAAAGIVAGARRRIAEWNALAVLAVLGERPVSEALLVAELDAREIENAVLHGAEHALAPAGAVALIERRDDAEREMQAGSGIADLRAGDERWAVEEPGGRGRATGALRDVLVHLAFFVRTGAEAFHRGHDHARVDLVDVLPGQPHAVERAGRKILDQHVALLDQPFEDFLALGVLGIDRDRPLVVVQHGEIERVRAFDVAQLGARDVADAGTLDLDTVGPEPGQQLRAGRAGLDVGEIEDLNAVERLAGLTVGLRRRLRQPIRSSLGGWFLRLQLHHLLGSRLRLCFRFCFAFRH